MKLSDNILVIFLTGTFLLWVYDVATATTCVNENGVILYTNVVCWEGYKLLSSSDSKINTPIENISKETRGCTCERAKAICELQCKIIESASFSGRVETCYQNCDYMAQTNCDELKKQYYACYQGSAADLENYAKGLRDRAKY